MKPKRIVSAALAAVLGAGFVYLIWASRPTTATKTLTLLHTNSVTAHLFPCPT